MDRKPFKRINATIRDDFSLCATNQFYSINNVIMNFEKYFYSVCKKENELGRKIGPLFLTRVSK